MNKSIIITLSGLLITMFSCKPQADSNTQRDNAPKIPQITNISKMPERLTKEVMTYTVTLITEENKVTLEDTEFSLDGKEWQKSAEFQSVTCGKYTFYARNKRNKSLQDQKEMSFECFVDVPLPTIPQLNELLKQIADCDDKASDALRVFGNNLPVRGIDNVSNMEQLLREACMNEVVFTVQKIETDTGGNLAAIVLQKI